MVRAQLGTSLAHLEPGRLFRQDRLIASNTILATFADWHDRAIAAFMVMATSAVAHAWFADHHWKVAAWTALGAGMPIGMRKMRPPFDGQRIGHDDTFPPATRIRWHWLSE